MKIIKKILSGTFIPNKYRSLYRKKYSKSLVINRIKALEFEPLTKEEKKHIISFWKQYVKNINFSSFIFYKKFCKLTSQLPYYLPEDIFYPIIDMYFTNPYLASIYDNKNIYDLYFHDVSQPKTIVRYMNGMFLDHHYKVISREDALAKCKSNEQIILKPASCSEGGRGILFIENTNQNFEVQLATFFAKNKDAIVQEIVKQHEILNTIHKDSLNTIRIITLLINNEVHPLSSILRMGRNGKRVDNASSGGVFCGINTDGSLKKMTYDCKGNTYEGHPNGTKTEGLVIPHFSQATEMVKHLAPRIMHISSLCSWDLALDKNGQYKLIEVNMSFGQLDFHQICNGPLFGNKTEEILKHVFAISLDRKLVNYE